MTAFILIESEAFSFLVCSLFVAATLFAMQTLRQIPPVFIYWSIAFAVGGIRYLITYLVTTIGLQFTVIFLDALIIAQSALMVLGVCCLDKNPVSRKTLIMGGSGLFVWGLLSSNIFTNWLWHDLPILLALSAAYVISGIKYYLFRKNHDSLTIHHISISATVVLIGLLYPILLFVNFESNIHWFFVVEQGLLIALGTALVFSILSNLQNQMHHIAPIDTATGTYTKEYFSHLLSTELNRAQRYRRPFAYILIRIDINNEDIGTLNQITKNIVKSLRDVDFIGKLNEFEFAVALPETSIDEAKHVAERQLTFIKDFNASDSSNAEAVVKIVLSDCRADDNADRIYDRSKKHMDESGQVNTISVFKEE
ncbi:MAG: diguanylate cyclase [Gammaproteobacteria bacterium]|nr:diguanylate cyclase [Gammaproteobacteria bacterium]MDH5776822.1 diguanylate cyclase [Gammaproteobacteria bacterium]